LAQKSDFEAPFGVSVTGITSKN